MKTNLSVPDIYQLFHSCNRVHTDSRSIQEGDFFVALKGERFDGNAYAAQSLQQGAHYALISDPSLEQNDRFILVEDTLKTLQNLATHHRRQFTFPVVALTGSNGKTTTKELIYQTLATTYRTHCTQGNLNNHIGVPLTLLRMPIDAEVAVIEMGANHQGEIDALCHIAEPSHGLITNIGKAHLEGFGGIEGVKKGKSEMYRYLHKTGGVIFINRDMDHLSELLPQGVNTISYGSEAFPDLVTQVKMEQADPVVKASWYSDQEEAFTAMAHIGGVYNFQNIKTAIAIGQYFKVDDQQIKTAIESYVSSNNRSQILKQGTFTFFLDAYNANPTSMAAALNHFQTSDATNKLLVLGDMLELGVEASKEHQAIVDQAIQMQVDHILLVGDHFQNISSSDPRVHQFLDAKEAASWLGKQPLSDVHILLKGSRKIALEQIPKFLKTPS